MNYRELTLADDIRRRLEDRPLRLSYGVKSIEYLFDYNRHVHYLLLRTNKLLSKALLTTPELTYPTYLLHHVISLWGELSHTMERAGVTLGMTELQAVRGKTLLTYKGVEYLNGSLHVPASNYAERAKSSDDVHSFDPWGGLLFRHQRVATSRKSSLVMLHLPSDMRDVDNDKLKKLLHIGYGWNVFNDAECTDEDLGAWAAAFMNADPVRTLRP